MTALQHDRLQELWDREQIRELVARYCRAVDRMQFEDGKALYFGDATEDHGVYRGSAWGLMDFFGQLLTEEYVGHHQLGQSIIEIDGDRALCETYFICAMAWNAPGQPLSFADVRGRYLDHLGRVEAGWQIAERVAILDLTVQRPMDPGWDIAEAFVSGKRWPDDLVYRPGNLGARIELGAEPLLGSAQ
jgi:SnoaL-like domain